MEPIIRYQCPVCKKDYDTPEEAKNCYKPIKERFKVGDIIQGSGRERPWKITILSHDSEIGAGIERIKEIDKAKQFYIPKGDLKKAWMIGGFWCTAKKFDLAEAEKIAKELRERANNAEKFLNMVKAMY
jgi:hypothetical protein